jgi:hypothetical protein
MFESLNFKTSFSFFWLFDKIYPFLFCLDEKELSIIGLKNKIKRLQIW